MKKTNESKNQHKNEIAFIDIWVQTNKLDPNKLSKENVAELLFTYSGVVRNITLSSESDKNSDGWDSGGSLCSSPHNSEDILRNILRDEG